MGLTRVCCRATHRRLPALVHGQACAWRRACACSASVGECGMRDSTGRSAGHYALPIHAANATVSMIPDT